MSCLNDYRDRYTDAERALMDVTMPGMLVLPYEVVPGATLFYNKTNRNTVCSLRVAKVGLVSEKTGSIYFTAIIRSPFEPYKEHETVKFYADVGLTKRHNLTRLFYAKEPAERWTTLCNAVRKTTFD